MNREAKKSSEAPRRETKNAEQAVLNELTNAGDKFDEVLKMGDPQNPLNRELNIQLGDEWARFNQEVKTEAEETIIALTKKRGAAEENKAEAEETPPVTLENLQRIKEICERRLKKIQAQEAQRQGPEASEAYFFSRQQAIEKAQKGKRPWKRL